MLAACQYATNTRLANIQPLANQLRKEPGVPVAVKTFPATQVADQATNNGEEVCLRK